MIFRSSVKNKKILLSVAIFILVVGLIFIFLLTKNFINQDGYLADGDLFIEQIDKKDPPIIVSEQPFAFVPPISRWAESMTKKPFGIFITKENSPVQPEKFSGYHSGVDFEILPGEENSSVPIYAVCDGELIFKNFVSGYGGLAIQSCALEGRPITVLYGHLLLSSIEIIVGSKLSIGEKIGVLGRGWSSETDGERKHLHLGIHRGGNIIYSGYVRTEADLAGWLDMTDYLRP